MDEDGLPTQGGMALLDGLDAFILARPQQAVVVLSGHMQHKLIRHLQQ